MMRPIDCRTYEFWSEDLEDASLDAGFRDALQAHRSDCPHCSDFALRTGHQRRAVHGLPRIQVPVSLAVNLRVLASKERSRRANRQDWSARMQGWRQQARLWFNNLWKPLAVPMAGGVASACFLFSALMPTFALQAGAATDVPAAWYQSAEVYQMSPFGMNAEQITVDVRIDMYGRVIDYSVPKGESCSWKKDAELRRAVENNLLFMTFRPAIFFGQPASDTIRITFRSSYIDVKG